MNRLFLSILTFSFLFSSCKSKTEVTLKNPINQDRKDATIIIAKSDLLENGIKIPKGKIPVLIQRDGKILASQIDDTNQDGNWDEISSVADFKKNESKEIRIEFRHPNKVPQYKQRTNVRLGIGNPEKGFKGVNQAFSPKGFTGIPIKYQAESVNWENDKMGFRNYFDCRNAKDLFGKTSSEMIMDKIGTKESGSYHQLSDWGMDVLHVGPSLGAGGLALVQNDSLHRLGSTETMEFQLISEGSVRSIFELRFSGWNVNGQKLKAIERISIWAGKYWFKSEVSIENLNNESELAIGIVTSKLKQSKAFELEINNGYIATGTHDRQSENKDFLGMAILLKSDNKIQIGDLGKLPNYINLKERWQQPIGETHFITQKISNKKPVSHYFFATWEKENPKWAESKNFKNLIVNEAYQISNPIVVSYQ